MTASPRARFCGCDNEPLLLRTGAKVYMKGDGVLTLNQKEAHSDYPAPIGEIDRRKRLRLSPESEKAIAAA